MAEHFLSLAARRLNCPEVRLTDDGLERLIAYDWPGNIRELHNVIDRAVILSQRGPLRIDLVLGHRDSLPYDRPVRPPADVAASGVPAGGGSRVLSRAELARRERENTVAALEQAGWKVSGPGGAAEILGVKPTTLASRLKRFGIERRR